MDASAFTAMPSLSLAPPGAPGLVFARVGGFAAMPSARAPGAKLVVFFTDSGRVVLNGTRLYPAVGPYAAYAAMDAAAILAAAFSPPPPTGLTLFSTPASLRARMREASSRAHRRRQDGTLAPLGAAAVGGAGPVQARRGLGVAARA